MLDYHGRLAINNMEMAGKGEWKCQCNSMLLEMNNNGTFPNTSPTLGNFEQLQKVRLFCLSKP